MATDTNRIDLSVVTYQNKIAVSLSTFFTAEELEQIDINVIKCICDQKADNPCGCMEYHKEFDDGKAFEIHCLIDTSVIPNTHFTSIRIKNSNLFQSDFKCNPNTMNADYIDLIIKRAINYDKFKNQDDLFYNKHHVIENFSDGMLKNIGTNIKYYDAIKELVLPIANECESHHDNYKGKEITIEKDFDHIHVKLQTVNKFVFKFTYTNTITSQHDFCYFLRNRIGLDMITMIVDRCKNKIQINNVNKKDL